MEKQRRAPARAEERNRVRAENGRRRRRRRKRSYLLYYLMLLLFVGIALILLSVTVLFNISSIEVRGNKAVRAESILAAAQVENGDNLFRLNVGDVEARVLRAVREVDAVTVERKLPATLCITVKEVQPSLNLKTDGGYLVLSERHRVLELNRAEPNPKALTLVGLEVGAVSLGDFVDMDKIELYKTVEEIRAAAQENGISEIREIDLSDIVNITLNCKNKYKIELGTVSDLNYKLKFVKKVLDEGLEKGVVNAKTAGRVYFKADNSLYKKTASKATSSAATSSAKTASTDAVSSEKTSSNPVSSQ